ncbi:MAG: hypothetical protein Q7J28_06410 [Caulobacter sp.]|nr:hypothetical protein [Caulobacter sp.]
MSAPEPLVLAFAVSPQADATNDLETRIKALLEAEAQTESLDGPEFSQINGSEIKADYLLGERRIVAELKTLNGDPRDRVQRQLQRRFSAPAAPIVYGRMGASAVLDGLPDRDDVLRAIHDISSRKVRDNLKKASDQIGAIKERLSLPSAAGLAIIMNENEEMIDAANFGFSTIRAFLENAEAYRNVDYIWASIEAVYIPMPNGQRGFPQLLICRDPAPPDADLQFLAQLLNSWARRNRASIQQITHGGDWQPLQPIYKNGPPKMSLY